MANAAKLLESTALRILMVGYPGTAKTGSLASILNAGFKIRMIDYDGNIEPLLYNANPAMLKNLDVVYLEDKMRPGAQYVEPVGIPTAFVDGIKLLDEWKYQEDGQTVSLGSSKDWGPDSVVVLDSLTKMGDAAMRRAMKLSNKTPATLTDRVWGLAMGEQMAFIEKLTSKNNKFHVIVLAHLKMIGPADIRQGDSKIAETLKEQVADILPIRLYPNALGRQLPQAIPNEFPIIIEAEKVTKVTGTTRTLNLAPKQLLDLKFPGSIGEELPSRLPVEDGLLRVFKALSPGSVELVQAQQKEKVNG